MCPPQGWRSSKFLVGEIMGWFSNSFMIWHSILDLTFLFQLSWLFLTDWLSLYLVRIHLLPFMNWYWTLISYSFYWFFLIWLLLTVWFHLLRSTIEYSSLTFHRLIRWFWASFSWFHCYYSGIRLCRWYLMLSFFLRLHIKLWCRLVRLVLRWFDLTYRVVVMNRFMII